jgi:diadenosine tetraphosphate (Ap4A) HIT family hydrolase
MYVGSFVEMKTFEDVVRGEREVVRVDEDEHHIAFLNPSPLRPGHTIVVTKRVVPYLFDLAPDEHARLWEFSRRVAVRIRERLPCERVCVGVIGWQVRHVHVHLVPTNADGEFPPLPGNPATRADLESVARLLGSADRG